MAESFNSKHVLDIIVNVDSSKMSELSSTIEKTQKKIESAEKVIYEARATIEACNSQIEIADNKTHDLKSNVESLKRVTSNSDLKTVASDLGKAVNSKSSGKGNKEDFSKIIQSLDNIAKNYSQIEKMQLSGFDSAISEKINTVIDSQREVVSALNALISQSSGGININDVLNSIDKFADDLSKSFAQVKTEVGKGSRKVSDKGFSPANGKRMSIPGDAGSPIDTQKIQNEIEKAVISEVKRASGANVDVSFKKFKEGSQASEVVIGNRMVVDAKRSAVQQAVSALHGSVHQSDDLGSKSFTGTSSLNNESKKKAAEIADETKTNISTFIRMVTSSITKSVINSASNFAEAGNFIEQSMSVHLGDKMSKKIASSLTSVLKTGINPDKIIADIGNQISNMSKGKDATGRELKRIGLQVGQEGSLVDKLGNSVSDIDFSRRVSQFNKRNATNPVRVNSYDIQTRNVAKNIYDSFMGEDFYKFSGINPNDKNTPMSMLSSLGTGLSNNAASGTHFNAGYLRSIESVAPDKKRIREYIENQKKVYSRYLETLHGSNSIYEKAFFAAGGSSLKDELMSKVETKTPEQLSTEIINRFNNIQSNGKTFDKLGKEEQQKILKSGEEEYQKATAFDALIKNVLGKYGYNHPSEIQNKKLKNRVNTIVDRISASVNNITNERQNVVAGNSNQNPKELSALNIDYAKLSNILSGNSKGWNYESRSVNIGRSLNEVINGDEGDASQLMELIASTGLDPSELMDNPSMAESNNGNDTVIDRAIAIAKEKGLTKKIDEKTLREKLSKIYNRVDKFDNGRIGSESTKFALGMYSAPNGIYNAMSGNNDYLSKYTDTDVGYGMRQARRGDFPQFFKDGNLQGWAKPLESMENQIPYLFNRTKTLEPSLNSLLGSERDLTNKISPELGENESRKMVQSIFKRFLDRQTMGPERNASSSEDIAKFVKEYISTNMPRKSSFIKEIESDKTFFNDIFNSISSANNTFASERASGYGMVNGEFTPTGGKFMSIPSGFSDDKASEIMNEVKKHIINKVNEMYGVKGKHFDRLGNVLGSRFDSIKKATNFMAGNINEMPLSKSSEQLNKALSSLGFNISDVIDKYDFKESAPEVSIAEEPAIKKQIEEQVGEQIGKQIKKRMLAKKAVKTPKISKGKTIGLPNSEDDLDKWIEENIGEKSLVGIRKPMDNSIENVSPVSRGVSNAVEMQGLKNLFDSITVFIAKIGDNFSNIKTSNSTNDAKLGSKTFSKEIVKSISLLSSSVKEGNVSIVESIQKLTDIMTGGRKAAHTDPDIEEAIKREKERRRLAAIRSEKTQESEPVKKATASEEERLGRQKYRLEKAKFETDLSKTAGNDKIEILKLRIQKLENDSKSAMVDSKDTVDSVMLKIELERLKRLRLKLEGKMSPEGESAKSELWRDDKRAFKAEKNSFAEKLESAPLIEKSAVIKNQIQKYKDMVSAYDAKLSETSDPKDATRNKERISAYKSEISLLERRLVRIGETITKSKQRDTVQISREEKKLANEELSQGKQARTVFNKVVEYGTASTMFYAMISNIKDAISTMAQFETQVVESTKVMNPLFNANQKVADSARMLGKEYGYGITESAKTMTVFAQQGKNVAEIVRLTEASLAAANTTTLSGVEATEALTAVLKQFNISDKYAMSVIDSWLEVESRTAITANTLAKSLQISGTAARLAGISFDEFNGMVSAVGSATRESGSQLGTAMKFIFSHMRTEESINQIQKLGIAVYNQDGTFRDLTSIFSDLNERWQTMTAEQKANTAITIAGTRRYNTLMVLMEKWADVVSATKMSEDSHGKSMRTNALVMDTYAKKMEKARASVASFYTTVAEGGARGILNRFQEIVYEISEIAGNGLFKNITGPLASAAVIGGGLAGIMRVADFAGVSQVFQGMGRNKDAYKIAGQRMTDLKKEAGFTGKDRFSSLGRYISTIDAESKSILYNKETGKYETGYDDARESKREELVKKRAEEVRASKQKELALRESTNKAMDGLLEREREYALELQRANGFFERRMVMAKRFLQDNATKMMVAGLTAQAVSGNEIFQDKESVTGRTMTGDVVGAGASVLEGMAAFGYLSRIFKGSKFGNLIAILPGIALTIKSGADVFNNAVDRFFFSSRRAALNFEKEDNRIKTMQSALQTLSTLREKEKKGETLSTEEMEAKDTALQEYTRANPLALRFKNGRIADDIGDSEFLRNKGEFENNRLKISDYQASLSIMGSGGKNLLSENAENKSGLVEELESRVKELKKLEGSTPESLKMSPAYLDKYNAILKKIGNVRDEINKLEEAQTKYESGFYSAVSQRGALFSNASRSKSESGLRIDRSLDYERTFREISKNNGLEETRKRVISEFTRSGFSGRTVRNQDEAIKSAVESGVAYALRRGAQTKDGRNQYYLTRFNTDTGMAKEENFALESGLNERQTKEKISQLAKIDSKAIFAATEISDTIFEYSVKEIDRFIKNSELVGDNIRKAFSANNERINKLVGMTSKFSISGIDGVYKGFEKTANEYSEWAKQARKQVGIYESRASQSVLSLMNTDKPDIATVKLAQLNSSLLRSENSNTLIGSLQSAMNTMGMYSTKNQVVEQLIGSVDKNYKLGDITGGAKAEGQEESRYNEFLKDAKKIEEFLSSLGFDSTSVESIRAAVQKSGGSPEEAKEMIRNTLRGVQSSAQADVNLRLDNALKATFDYISDSAQKVKSSFENISKLREKDLYTGISSSGIITNEQRIASYDSSREYIEGMNADLEIMSGIRSQMRDMLEASRGEMEKAKARRDETLKRGGTAQDIKSSEEQLSFYENTYRKQKESMDALSEAYKSFQNTAREAEALTSESFAKTSIFLRNIDKESKIRNLETGVLNYGQTSSQRDSLLVLADKQTEAVSKLKTLEEESRFLSKMQKDGNITAEQLKKLDSTNASIGILEKFLYDNGIKLEESRRLLEEANAQRTKQLRSTTNEFFFNKMTRGQNTLQSQKGLFDMLHTESMNTVKSFTSMLTDPRYKGQVGNGDTDLILGAMSYLSNIKEQADRQGDVGYQKNYILASSQEKAVVDQIEAMKDSGLSLEQIFSDSGMKEMAKKSPLVQQTLDRMLQRDQNLKLESLQKEHIDVSRDMLKILEEISNKAGNSALGDETKNLLNLLKTYDSQTKEQKKIESRYFPVPGASSGFAGVTGSGGKHQSSGMIEVHKGEGLGVINATAMARNPGLSREILKTISGMNNGSISSYASGTKFSSPEEAKEFYKGQTSLLSDIYKSSLNNILNDYESGKLKNGRGIISENVLLSRLERFRQMLENLNKGSSDIRNIEGMDLFHGGQKELRLKDIRMDKVSTRGEYNMGGLYVTPNQDIASAYTGERGGIVTKFKGNKSALSLQFGNNDSRGTGTGIIFPEIIKAVKNLGFSFLHGNIERNYPTKILEELVAVEKNALVETRKIVKINPMAKSKSEPRAISSLEDIYEMSKFGEIKEATGLGITSKTVLNRFGGKAFTYKNPDEVSTKYQSSAAFGKDVFLSSVMNPLRFELHETLGHVLRDSGKRPVKNLVSGEFISDIMGRSGGYNLSYNNRVMGGLTKGLPTSGKNNFYALEQSLAIVRQRLAQDPAKSSKMIGKYSDSIRAGYGSDSVKSSPRFFKTPELGQIMSDLQRHEELIKGFRNTPWMDRYKASGNVFSATSSYLIDKYGIDQTQGIKQPGAIRALNAASRVSVNTSKFIPKTSGGIFATAMGIQATDAGIKLLRNNYENTESGVQSRREDIQRLTENASGMALIGGSNYGSKALMSYGERQLASGNNIKGGLSKFGGKLIRQGGPVVMASMAANEVYKLIKNKKRTSEDYIEAGGNIANMASYLIPGRVIGALADVVGSAVETTDKSLFGGTGVGKTTTRGLKAVNSMFESVIDSAKEGLKRQGSDKYNVNASVNDKILKEAGLSTGWGSLTSAANTLHRFFAKDDFEKSQNEVLSAVTGTGEDMGAGRVNLGDPQKELKILESVVKDYIKKGGGNINDRELVRTTLETGPLKERYKNIQERIKATTFKKTKAPETVIIGKRNEKQKEEDLKQRGNEDFLGYVTRQIEILNKEKSSIELDKRREYTKYYMRLQDEDPSSKKWDAKRVDEEIKKRYGFDYNEYRSGEMKSIDRDIAENKEVYKGEEKKRVVSEPRKKKEVSKTRKPSREESMRDIAAISERIKDISYKQREVMGKKLPGFMKKTRDEMTEDERKELDTLEAKRDEIASGLIGGDAQVKGKEKESGDFITINGKKYRSFKSGEELKRALKNRGKKKGGEINKIIKESNELYRPDSAFTPEVKDKMRDYPTLREAMNGDYKGESFDFTSDGRFTPRGKAEENLDKMRGEQAVLNVKNPDKEAGGKEQVDAIKDVSDGINESVEATRDGNKEITKRLDRVITAINNSKMNSGYRLGDKIPEVA